MSEIELPEPAAVWRGDQTFHLNPAGLHMERWRDHALYSAEQVRRLVAAERERCARVCEELRDKALSAQHGRSDDLQNVMLRQVAHTGAGECAAAIRRGSV